MEPVEVTYTPDDADRRLMVDRILEGRNPGVGRLLPDWATVLPGFVLPIVLLAAGHFLLGIPVYFLYLLLIIEFAALAYIVLMPIIFKRSRILTRSNEFGPVTVRLTAAGLEVDYKSTRSVTNWVGIGGMTDDAVAIYVGRRVVVPKRVFGTKGECERFLSTARQLAAEAYQPNRVPATKSYGVVSIRYTHAMPFDYQDLTDATSVASQRSRRYLRASLLVSRLAGLGLVIWMVAPVYAWWVNRHGFLSTWPIWPALAIVLTTVFYKKWVAREPHDDAFNKSMRSVMSSMAGFGETSELMLSSRGLCSRVGETESVTPWIAISQVRVAKTIVSFSGTNSRVVKFVPRVAFASEEDVEYFIAVAKAFIAADRSGEPVELPPRPSVWPPAPGSG